MLVLLAQFRLEMPLDQTSWLRPRALLLFILWGGLRVQRLGSLWRRLSWKMLSRSTLSTSQLSP